MKMITLSLLLILSLTACTPRVGIGVGGVVTSGESVTVSEIHADSQNGIHGSVSMGTDITL